MKHYDKSHGPRVQAEGREAYSELLASAALAEDAEAAQLDADREKRREEKADPTYQPEEDGFDKSGEAEDCDEEEPRGGPEPGERLEREVEKAFKAREAKGVAVLMEPADLSFFSAVMANGGKAPRPLKSEKKGKGTPGKPGRPAVSSWNTLKVGSAIFKPEHVEKIGSKALLRQLITNHIVAPLDAETGEAREAPDSGKLPYLRQILVNARPAAEESSSA